MTTSCSGLRSWLVLLSAVVCAAAVVMICSKGLSSPYAEFHTSWAYGATSILYAFAALLTLEAFATWLCVVPPASLQAAAAAAGGSGEEGGEDAALVAADASAAAASAPPPWGWSAEVSDSDDGRSGGSGIGSGTDDLEPRRRGCCGHCATISTSAAPPLLFALAFTTRAVWFALRARKGASACAAGPPIVHPPSAPSLGDFDRSLSCASSDPCCAHFVDNGEEHHFAHMHVGFATILARLGNGILMAAFACVGMSWLRIADDVRAAFEPNARLGGEDGFGDGGVGGSGGGARGESVELHHGSDELAPRTCSVKWWRRLGRSAALWGDRIALCVLVALTFWACVFEAAVLALHWRMRGNGVTPPSRRKRCFAAKADFAEKLAVGLTFGLLGIVLLSQGVRLVALIEQSRTVEVRHVLHTVRVKLRAIIVIVFVGLTCVKCGTVLLPAVAHVGFGGELCTAFSPWLWYPLGEVPPALFIIIVTSPRSLCNRASAACAALCGLVGKPGERANRAEARRSSSYGATGVRGGLAV